MTNPLKRYKCYKYTLEIKTCMILVFTLKLLFQQKKLSCYFTIQELKLNKQKISYNLQQINKPQQ